MRRSNQTQQSCGVTWMELMQVDQLKERFPWLNTDNIALGSFGRENEGYFDPWSLLTALKAKAISQGVDYIDGEVIHAQVGRAGDGKVRIDSVGYSVGASSSVVEEVAAGVVVNVSADVICLPRVLH
jgi:FAD-dependent oxidoreductase domain-containing protein 1